MPLASLASQAWDLLSHPPDAVPHWLALPARGAGRASGGTVSSPITLYTLLQSREAYSLHLGINLTHPSLRFRPRSSEITHISNLLFDIDVRDHDAKPLSFASELISNAESLLSLRLSPSIIDTGRGIQLWFPTSGGSLDSHEARTQWRIHIGLLLRHLMASGHGCVLDTSTGDLPRVGRLVGSVNHKTGRIAQLLTLGSPCPNLIDAVTRFGISASADAVEHLSKYDGNVRRWQHAIDLIPHATARIFLTEGVPEPGRHSAAWHAAASLAELGVGLEAAIKAVRFGARLCNPRLPAADSDRAVRCAYNREAKDGPQTRCRIHTP